MLLVGLTGGIGSGKSAVARGFAERGATVIDADQVAREVVQPGNPAYSSIVERFGAGVVLPSGDLDRSALAARVFNSPAELAELNRITHPAIVAGIRRRIATVEGAAAGTDSVSRVSGGQVRAGEATGGVVVLELPLLERSGVSGYGLEAVIVVDAPEELAISRLVGLRGLTESDARARVAAQMSREDRRRLADLVIDNSGDAAALRSEVERAWDWIRSLMATKSTLG